jgi:hypothetical protein
MNTSKVIRSGRGRSGQVVRSGVFQVVRSGRGRSGQVVRSGVFQVVRSGRGRSGQVAAGHGKVYFQVRDP